MSHIPRVNHPSQPALANPGREPSFAGGSLAAGQSGPARASGFLPPQLPTAAAQADGLGVWAEPARGQNGPGVGQGVRQRPGVMTLFIAVGDLNGSLTVGNRSNMCRSFPASEQGTYNTSEQNINNGDR